MIQHLESRTFVPGQDEGISDGASPVYAAAMKDHTEVHCGGHVTLSLKSR